MLNEYEKCNVYFCYRVPNAPKSSIGELFKSDATDNGHKRNGINRPRVSRDKLDTHSRLFGQVSNFCYLH